VKERGKKKRIRQRPPSGAFLQRKTVGRRVASFKVPHLRVKRGTSPSDKKITRLLNVAIMGKPGIHYKQEQGEYSKRHSSGEQGGDSVIRWASKL